MATYKLIQDIEAEDHIIGPLTLRQFIFALVAAFLYYLSFIVVAKHVTFMLVLFLPPALFCTFFAIPFGRDQPTEIWALAKLRFLFKPRRRIWDQSGVKELVTITVPKKVERVLTNGLSQTEVQSRLKVLANTLDTRGWAIKNVNVNSYAPPNPMAGGDSDRLIDINNAPQEVPNYDVQAQDDILDETSNPVAQQFQSMINQSSQQHRQHLMDELNGIRAGQPAPAAAAAAPANNNYWFMSPGTPVATAASGLPGPVAAPNDDALSAQLKAQKNKATGVSYAHMRTLQPLGSQGTQAQTTAPPQASAPVPQPVAPAQPAAPQQSQATPPTPSAPGSDAAILSLANNDDLNVSTLARQARKAKDGDESSQDEVVISLR